MKRPLRCLAFAVATILSTSIPSWGQTDNSPAAAEILAGSRLYRAGKFAEAQRHFERALELDPAHKNAPVFVARAIHAQFKPGAEEQTNVDTARRAIAAYKAVLESNPSNDDAYNAVAYLYGAIKADEEQTSWVEERANNADLPAEKRAEAYTVLASKKWDCSFKVTERRENQQTTMQDGKANIKFVMPKDVGEFMSAQRCVDEGLNLIEQAVSLNSGSEAAWSYKTNLLREKARLAEMQGRAQEKEMWTQQADEARKRTAELSGRK